MAAEKIICSLCQHEIPASYLRQHQAAEVKEIETYTIELIKQSHPGWSDGDPTCQKCWDEYRNISSA